MVCLLLLSSCDSGDGGDPTPTPTPATSPTPTPTLTPAPTPTPTPSPVPASFPLEAREQFNVGLYASSIIESSSIHLGAAYPPRLATISQNGSLRVTLAPAAPSNNPEGFWGIVEGSSSPNFNSSSPPNGERELTGTERGAFGDRLVVLNNFWPTGTVQDPAYQFNYVSYVLWRERNPTIVYPLRNVVAAIGYPSGSSVIPITGDHSFSAVSRASVFTVRDTTAQDNTSNFVEEDAFGIATVRINYAAGTVTVEWTLSVIRNGTTVLLGTMHGSGVIGSDRSTLSGAFTSVDSRLTGQFTGRFYGPAGQETGLVISLNGPVSNEVRAPEQRIVGIISGK